MRWWRHGVFVVALALGALLAAGCGGSASSNPSETPDTQSAVYASDFRISAYQGSDALGGEEVWLSSLFSQASGERPPIVLNFWAGQCPPCRAEMPDLQEVYEEYGDRVLLFGLDVGPFVGLGSRDDGRALLADLGVIYPAGTTFDQEVVRSYRVVGMPTTYLIKSDGEILRSWTGLLTKDKMVDLVEELLNAS